MDFQVSTKILFYICIAVAVFFLVEAVFLAISGPLSRQKSVNRRLHKLKAGKSGEEVLNLLKQERGIFGQDLAVIGWLRKLLIQSGLRMKAGQLALILFGVTATILAATQILRARVSPMP